MTQPFRLARGGRIDRSRPTTFSFNGKSVHGYLGDTVASALLANGIHFVGRSFKYHRPRGILAAGPEEPNALVDVDRGGDRREPNNQATVVEAFDGLVTRSQNHWPSLEVDIGALGDRLSPLLASGFYYKTFMWPRNAWAKLYEPAIRAAAGLGVAPTVPDPDRYAHRHAHCEVLVVGAGPAGLAAALAAAASGKCVIICDEQAEMGGSLLADLTSGIAGLPAAEWLRQTLQTLAAAGNVTLLPRTTAFGYYNHNHVALAERCTDHLADPAPGRVRERLWQVRAGTVVLATGVHERPLVFPDNDRPGIMLAEAVRTYVNRYAVLPGRDVVVATNGASAYRAAIDTMKAGARVRIIDMRSADACGPELAAAREAGIEVLNGFAAVGSKGRRRVTALRIARIDGEGAVGPVADARWLACDCVAMSGGWAPVMHLFSQSRGRLAFDRARDAFLPGASAQNERSAGAAAGHHDLAACLASGAEAGSRAVERDPAPSTRVTSHAEPVGFCRFPPVALDASPRGKAFVDFQNDVTAKDLKLAVQEGFESIEHVKRYTTTGMATDQGKTSNLNALGVVASVLGREIADVGTTTFRLPYTPVTFGSFAGQSRGDLFDPVRWTPLHDRAARLGAVFEDVGTWKRAHYFPRRGESMHVAVQREARAVRASVGIFDASTLGKIEVAGRDAAKFLDRLYVNSFSKLAPGRCRYAIMLREDGFVFDDGIVGRIAADRFHVTTTTGGAARVLAHMEDYLQTEFTDLDVFLCSTTEHWAVIAVQGPKAGAVIASIVEDADISDQTLRHMSVTDGRIAGVPVRIFRASFTGEAGYEINVPADHAEIVWDAVWDAGQAFGMTPYGTEAMHVLRAECGFIIVGQETDGTVTIDDLGLGRMVAAGKHDFIGKRSLARADLLSAGRKQMVGLLASDPDEVLDEGAQIVETPNQPLPMRMLGHVTSSYMSPNVGRSIAMALVSGGRDRLGATLHVTTPKGFTTATVVAPVFLEPRGAEPNG